MATKKGLEPSTSGVTGRRSNRLNYLAIARLIYQIHSNLSIDFLKKILDSGEDAFLPFSSGQGSTITDEDGEA